MMLRFMVSSILAGCVFGAALAAEKPIGPATAWVPENAVIALELQHPDQLLDRICDPAVQKKFNSIPAIQAGLKTPQFRQFLAVVRYLETMLDTDWQTALHKLLGGGVTLAVGPKGESLLIVDTTDADLLRKLHETLVGFARSDAEKKGQSDRVQSRDYQGVTVWTLGGDEYHAIVGHRLIVANRQEALTAALDLHAKSAKGSLAQTPHYQASRKRLDAAAAATAFVDLEALKRNPGFRRALDQNQNPLAVLLFGPALDALKQADWVGAELAIEEDTVRLTAALPGSQTDSVQLARPGSDAGGAWPNLSVPGRIAALTLYRDLHAFYAAKDRLFPERTSGLIFFENMMGIFFTGRNLTDEVLAETCPGVRVVVANPQFDPAVGTPDTQFPAFATVLRLQHPDAFGEVVEEAWQKALGLINFTRGQQALPGLIIDRVTHNGTKFTVAYFASGHETDRDHLDVRFNFRPAVAMTGDYLILSSTEALTRDLIDALNQERAQHTAPLKSTDALLEIDGHALAQILAVNRENLIRQNMIEKGNTEQQAGGETDMMLTIVEHFGQASFRIDQSQGQVLARLAVQVVLDPASVRGSARRMPEKRTQARTVATGP